MAQDVNVGAPVHGGAVVIAGSSIGGDSLLPPFENQRTDVSEAHPLVLYLAMKFLLGGVHHEGHKRPVLGPDLETLPTHKRQIVTQGAQSGEGWIGLGVQGFAAASTIVTNSCCSAVMEAIMSIDLFTAQRFEMVPSELVTANAQPAIFPALASISATSSNSITSMRLGVAGATSLPVWMCTTRVGWGMSVTTTYAPCLCPWCFWTLVSNGNQPC